MPKKRLKTIAEEHEVELDYIVELVEAKLPVHTITGTGYARWINEEGQSLRSYVYVYIHEIQQKVPMVIARKLEDWLTKGKQVNVEAIQDEKGTSYRYVR